MQRIKLILEYDGAEFHGWQIQTGQYTVQEELERCFSVLFKTQIRVIAAGRTDTGVHARNQVVHCDIPQYDLYRLKRSLNGLLRRDVAVKGISAVQPDFHARFDAGSRLYRYYISTEVTALNRHYSWTIHSPLNTTLMQEGAKVISEFENFKSFCKVNSKVDHYRCTIISSRWYRRNELLVYEVRANRFLHGMVRAIVGTLVELGRGRITLAGLREMIEAQDRTRIPATAPPQGLVLEQIDY